jgi:hypothetical protein
VSIAVAVIAAIINFFAIKFLFKLYVKNIRHAFKVHFDSDYAPVEKNLKEYSPNDSEEEEMIQDPATAMAKEDQRNAPVKELLDEDITGKKAAGEASKDELHA